MVHRVEELGGLGLLGLLPAVHHDDAVGAPGDDAHVVGDEEQAHVELGTEAIDDVQDLGLDRHVERRRGLVGDQELGPTDESHGDDHTLAQTTRELEGVLTEPFLGPRHLHHLQYLEGAETRLLVGRAFVDAQPFTDLTPDLGRRVERAHRVLGDQRHGLAAIVAHLLLGQRRQVDVVEHDVAFDDLAVAGQQSHDRETRGRLSAAGLTDQADALTGVDGQGKVIDGGGEGISCRELNLQAVDREQRRHNWTILVF